MITRGFESSHGIKVINPRISITVQATLLIATLAVMGILSVGAAMQNFYAGDLYLTRDFQSLPYPFWSWTMETATFIGNGPILMVGAIACRYLVPSQGPNSRVPLVIAGLLSAPLALALKVILGREHPTSELVVVWRNLHSLSFPNGHAFTAVLAFGLVCYLAPRLTNNKHMVTALRTS